MAGGPLEHGESRATNCMARIVASAIGDDDGVSSVCEELRSLSWQQVQHTITPPGA